MSGRTQLPTYSANKFVDRAEELKLIRNIVAELVKHKQTDTKIVTFYGERGIGKTWLLARLEEDLKENFPSKVAVVRIDVQDLESGDTIGRVARLIRHIWEQLGGSPPRGQYVEDLSRMFMDFLREKILDSKAFILLLDHLHESDWEFLDALEDYLLAPLATEPRTLIVTTGRRRLYVWKTAELYLRQRLIKLEPFKKEEIIKDQIRRQIAHPRVNVQEILQLTCGNPLANYLVASHGSDEKGIRETLERLLADVPNKTRREILRYAEALADKESFRDAEIYTILRNRGIPPLRVRQMLSQWDIAYWDTSKRGFVLEPTIRALVNHLRKNLAGNGKKGQGDPQSQERPRTVSMSASKNTLASTQPHSPIF